MQIQDSLKKLIRSQKLSSQSEILALLRRDGHEVNQSTVSRALKALGVLKLRDQGGSAYYRLPKDSDSAELPLRQVVLSVESNQSLVVVKSQAGLASLVSLEIEKHCADDILGTIAGEDTVFVAARSKSSLPILKKNILALAR